jgi:lysophospholipase L1-like esterase
MKTKITLGNITALILTILFLVVYLLFMSYTYTHTFSGHITPVFIVYMVLFLPVTALPLVMHILYRKFGRAYVLFTALTVFFLMLFFIFAKTIMFRDKYRIFDPFLQIQPVLMPEMFQAKKPDEVRILFLGGSTTRCAALPENERYPELVRKKLQAMYPSKHVSVLNAGMDWFTTRHSLIAFTNYYTVWQPDLVLVMHTINDVCRSFTPLRMSTPYFKADYSHFYGPSAFAAFPERSYPEKLLNDVERFVNVQIRGRKDTPIDFDSTAFKSEASFIYFYGLLLDAIIASGAKAIVVTEPSVYAGVSHDSIESRLWFGKAFCYNQSENGYRDYGRKYASHHALGKAMERFNAIALNEATTRHTLYYNLAGIIPPSPRFFTDDVHFTPSGTTLAADSIAAFLGRVLGK